MTPSHIRLKDLIVEMPQLGSFITDDAAREMQRFLHTVEVNPGGMLGNVYQRPIDDDFFYLKGFAGGAYDLWIALFKRTGDGCDLCFASGLKQVNWLIEGLVTYKVSFSKRYTDQPKRAAAETYLKLATAFDKGVVLTSDTHISDDGSWIWKELLTRPGLDVFVWNLKEQRRENALDWHEVFGHADRFADLVVALKTPPKN